MRARSCHTVPDPLSAPQSERSFYATHRTIGMMPYSQWPVRACAMPRAIVSHLSRVCPSQRELQEALLLALGRVRLRLPLALLEHGRDHRLPSPLELEDS